MDDKETSKKLGKMISVRLSPEELDRIRQRAPERGVSQFVRDAVLDSIQPTPQPDVARTGARSVSSLGGSASIVSTNYGSLTGPESPSINIRMHG